MMRPRVRLGFFKSPAVNTCGLDERKTKYRISVQTKLAQEFEGISSKLFITSFEFATT